MGSTDLAFAMITGENRFKVPESIKVVFSGKPKQHVYGKDLIFEFFCLYFFVGYQTVNLLGLVVLVVGDGESCALS